MSRTFRIPKARGDDDLKSYAQLASAAAIGRSWYLDLAHFEATNDALDIVKVREVRRWRESDVFTDLERDVMEYAEALSATPPTVTDWMVDKLLDQLGEPAVVELTRVIAVENMRSRFSTAVDLRTARCSGVSELPLARPTAVPSGS